MSEDRTTPVETTKDFGKPPAGPVKRWLAEIDLYEREYENYHKRVTDIIKRYRDERDSDSTTRKMNILWSNIETLKPAVYAKPPAPDVQRRFKDKDPVGKAASQVLERSLAYHIDSYDFDATLKKCRDDYLLGSRGTAWVRYDPVIQQGVSQGQSGQDYEEVVSEHVACDYVYWKDFGHTPARTWDEVDAVWRKVYLTRDRLIERFGEKIGKEVQLDTKPESMSKDEAEKHGETFKTACVYEIWDKRDRKAIWVARGYKGGALDTKDDPLKLERFFPCPRPLYGNLTTGTLVPLPDYAQYQDQAKEIDVLTDRIASLTETLKSVGWYAGDQKNQIESVKKAKDGDLIPVMNWAALAEKGGMKNMIEWMPVQDVANVVQALNEMRMQMKADLMEVTGLSDIVRGQGDASETATAQQIKGQFASMRLKDRQGEMARFSRDLLRIKAEIIAEQFGAETLAMMSGLQFPMTEAERTAPMLQYQQAMQQFQMQQMAAQQMAPQAPTGQPNPQMGNGSQPAQSSAPEPPQPPEQPEIEEVSWEAIVTLLRDDRLRSYRIDIETDSTIALDEQLEKEQASELLTAVTPYLQGMTEALQTAPAMLELMGQMLMATTRKYKMGRSLEETFERTIDELKQIASQPRPDPAQQELQMEAQKAQQQIQVQQAQAQSDAQLAQQKAATEQQMKQAELDADMRRKDLELQHEMKLEEMKLAHEFKIEELKAGLEAEKIRTETELKRQQAETDSQLKSDQAVLDYSIKSESERAKADLAERSEATASKSKEVESQATAKVMAAMQKTLERLAAPRTAKIVRGKDGKATGATFAIEGNA